LIAAIPAFIGAMAAGFTVMIRALTGEPATAAVVCDLYDEHGESVAVSRSLFQTAHALGDEQRFESPHFIEIADDNDRTTIVTHGLPFHRKIGPRMVDTLLVSLEFESVRRSTVEFAKLVRRRFRS